MLSPSTIPFLTCLFLLSVHFAGLVSGGVVPGQTLQVQQAAQSSKCGPQPNGAVYTCPFKEPCCHPNGYCVGSDEIYCHVADGCLTQFSASSNQCKQGEAGSSGVGFGNDPDDPTIPVSSGTFCGVDDSGELLGACPNKVGVKCCSSAGTCGEDSDHCSLRSGCQSPYGVCWDEMRKNPGSEGQGSGKGSSPGNGDENRGSGEKDWGPESGNGSGRDDGSSSTPGRSRGRGRGGTGGGAGGASGGGEAEDEGEGETYEGDGEYYEEGEDEGESDEWDNGQGDEYGDDWGYDNQGNVNRVR